MTRKRKTNRQYREYTTSTLFLTLLSACGGGGGSSSAPRDPILDDGDSISSSGKVIDGYISGARVFRDVNQNLSFDEFETYVTTNDSGEYFNLIGSSNAQIVADTNNNKAVDKSNGLPLSITLSAPSEYSVVSPLSTLILAVQKTGLSKSNAEQAVKNVFGLNSQVDLGVYDPVATFDSTLTRESQSLMKSYQ